MTGLLTSSFYSARNRETSLAPQAWALHIRVITAALQREEQLGSSNVIIVYAVIFVLLAFLFWLSGDGNTLRLTQALNALTGYAFEAQPKKPKLNNPYGAFSSV